MKYSKKKHLFIQNENFRHEVEQIVDNYSFETYNLYREKVNYMLELLKHFDTESEELPFTRFNYNTLPEIVENIVEFDYKVNDFEYLREAFIELYKKLRSKHDPQLLKDVITNSKEVPKHALGMYGTQLFFDDPKIYIMRTRKSMRNGKPYMVTGQERFGMGYLATFIHEMKHEQQEASMFKFLSGQKLSKKDMIDVLYRLALTYGMGKYRAKYFDRYYEFQAEYTANKTLYNFLKDGTIKNTKINKLALYEFIVDQLNNFDMKKIIAMQKRFTKVIFGDLSIYVKGFNRYDTINNFAIMETILKNSDKYITEIYNLSLNNLPQNISTKEKFELLMEVYNEYKKDLVENEMKYVNVEGLTEKQIQDFRFQSNKDIEKDICKLLYKCIEKAVEVNLEAYPNNEKLKEEGEYILKNLPKKFRNINEIKEFFDDILIVKDMPMFNRFFEISKEDIDKYSDQLLKEYQDLENMAFLLQKEILSELSDDEIQYMYDNVSKSKYNNAENNSKYMTHIENGNSYIYGKSMHFIYGCLSAWENTKEKIANLKNTCKKQNINENINQNENVM